MNQADVLMALWFAVSCFAIGYASLYLYYSYKLDAKEKTTEKGAEDE